MAYLDRITGTRPLPVAVAAMQGCLEMSAANPQSPSRSGTQARRILDCARDHVAELIGAEPREITFVSNGTESVNLAIRGMALSAARGRTHRKIIVSAVEHPSVMNTVRALEKQGFVTAIVPVDGQGRVDIDAYREALETNALLASVQWVNPEVGTIQDIALLAAIARENGVLFHTDAVDAVGWMPISVAETGVDALSFSGTQFHGPPGGAALYVRKGLSMIPILTGGLQERHRRPGLENIPAIAGFGEAAREAMEGMPQRIDHARTLARQLRDGVAHIEAVTLTGDWENRIPGHVSLLVHYVEGEALLLMLDMKGIQATSGSSCTAKDLKISPVLMAMGIDHTGAQGSLVFSTTVETTPEDITAVLTHLPGIVERLRAMSPLWKK